MAALYSFMCGSIEHAVNYLSSLCGVVWEVLLHHCGGELLQSRAFIRLLISISVRTTSSIVIHGSSRKGQSRPFHDHEQRRASLVIILNVHSLREVLYELLCKLRC